MYGSSLSPNYVTQAASSSKLVVDVRLVTVEPNLGVSSVGNMNLHCTCARWSALRSEFLVTESELLSGMLDVWKSVCDEPTFRAGSLRSFM